MKYSCPKAKAIIADFNKSVNMLLTELEWKLGLLKR